MIFFFFFLTLNHSFFRFGWSHRKLASFHMHKNGTRAEVGHGEICFREAVETGLLHVGVLGWGGERDFGRERERKGILGELMCCCWVAIRVRVRQRAREHKRERERERISAWKRESETERTRIVFAVCLGVSSIFISVKWALTWRNLKRAASKRKKGWQRMTRNHHF